MRARLRLTGAVAGVLCACWLSSLAGCGGGLKFVSVKGTATLDGKPLTGAVVSFNPDAAKGNKLRIACTGRITGDGSYEIYTDDGSKVRKGAPLGWYKVTLMTGLPGAPEIAVNPRYLDMDQTPFSIEVVADPPPGAYDLKVSK